MTETTYDFYTSQYYGGVVPETAFSGYADRAMDRLDAITFCRLSGIGLSDSNDETKVQKAICAIAECLYLIDTIRNSAAESLGTIKHEDGTLSSKVLSSVSSGSESISFATTGITGADMYTKAATDKTEENKLIRQISAEYLQNVKDAKGTLLLYAGR